MADDISNVLILNKKSIQSQENQIFVTELEKFRPYQNRLLQMAHKQASLMKELTSAYGDLLQDKRIRAEQNKYESLSRQRNGVLTKFKKTHQAFLDITAGLGKAMEFYLEMVETVESLEKNVETFVVNRRTEGAQLLAQIESDKSSEAEREQKRMQELMERMNMNRDSKKAPLRPAPLKDFSRHDQVSTPQQTPSHIMPERSSPPPTPRYAPHAPAQSGYYASATPPPPPPPPPPGPPASSTFPPYQYPPAPPTNGQYPGQPQTPRRESYPVPQMATFNRPSAYQLPGTPRRESHSHANMPASPTPTQTHMQYQNMHYAGQQYQQGYPPQQHQPHTPSHQPYNPGAYAVPPPPPPPPGPPRQQYGQMQQQAYQHQPPPTPGQQGQYYSQQQQQQQGPPGQQQGDPWSGLSQWK